MGGPGYSIKGEFRGNGFTEQLKAEVEYYLRTMAPNSVLLNFL